MRGRTIIGLIFLLAAIAGPLAFVHISNQQLVDEGRAALTAARAAIPDATAAPEDPAVALPALEALDASPLARQSPEWWRRASVNFAQMDDLAAETGRLRRDLLRDAFLRRF